MIPSDEQPNPIAPEIPQELVDPFSRPDTPAEENDWSKVVGHGV